MSQHASGFARRFPEVGRWAQVVALLLLLGLLAAMAVGPFKQLLEQRNRISSVTAQLEELESNNAELQTTIDRLQDPDYIEQEARARAGLIRPGEIPFVVMPPSDAKRAEAHAARKQKRVSAAPAEPGLLQSFVAFLGF